MSIELQNDGMLGLTADERLERDEAKAYRSLARKARRQRGLAVAIVIVFAVALNMFAPANPTTAERVYATTLMIIAALPSYWWVGEPRFSFPFLPLICGVYVAYYSIPIFTATHYYHDLFLPMSVPDIYVEEALQLAIGGLVAMILGYHSLRRKWLQRTVLQLRMVWEEQIGIELTAISIGLAGMAFYYVRVLITLPVALQQILRLTSDLSLISIAILFTLQLKGGIAVSSKIFLWGVLVPTRALLGFGTGATFQGAEVLLFLILVYATVRQRFPLPAMGIGIALLLATVPLRGEFRERTWSGAEVHLSPAEKVRVYVESFNNLIQGRGMRYADALQTSISRLSHLFTFSEVVQLTPTTIPYWMGETYKPLLFKPVPRFLYPDKPTENTGQLFGHRYAFLGQGDDETSYNLPLLVEWYANFGLFGVLGGMFITGMIYRLIEHYLTYSVLGVGAVAAAVFIMSRLLVIENSLSLVLGGIIWQVALLFGLNYLMQIGGGGGTRAAD